MNVECLAIHVAYDFMKSSLIYLQEIVIATWKLAQSTDKEKEGESN